MPHKLLSIYLLLITLTTLVLSSFHPTSAQTTVTCGGAGYDMSALSATDLTFQNNTSPFNTYYVHPCGNILNANCSSNPVMFCQYNARQLSYVKFATYNTTATQWLAVTGGVVQQSQNGDFCAAINAYRSATIFYHCNASATTAVISAVSQYQNCHWRATIETQLACAAMGATASHSVGSSYQDTRCGGGVFDLSTATSSNQPLTLDSGGTFTALSLCGSLATSNCSAGSSACLTTKASSTSVSLSTYTPSQWVWTLSNSTGITQQQQTGDNCATAGANYGLTINYICNAAAITAQLVSVTQGETCFYVATVQTAAACHRVDVISSSSSTGVSVGSSSSSGGGGGRGNGGMSAHVSGGVVWSAVVLCVLAVSLGVTM